MQTKPYPVCNINVIAFIFVCVEIGPKTIQLGHWVTNFTNSAGIRLSHKNWRPLAHAQKVRRKAAAQLSIAMDHGAWNKLTSFICLKIYSHYKAAYTMSTSLRCLSSIF